MKGFLIGLTSFILFAIVSFGIYILFFPSGRALINSYDNMMKKVDDRTTYEIRKKVEDTARASIVSYKTDKSIYEMYKDSENKEKQSWGEQAKMMHKINKKLKKDVS